MRLEGFLIRTHIVLVDKLSKTGENIKGKTDTFKDVVIDGVEDDLSRFLGKYVAVRVHNSTSKTLFGKFEKEVTIQDFYNDSKGKAYY